MGLFPCACEGRETPTLLGPLERANLSHWIHFSENVYFILFIILDNGQIPGTR
jgi:hypothetical protein